MVALDLQTRSDDALRRLAVIDGPFDQAALSGILARWPVSFGDGACKRDSGSACSHGTFVVGMLGAREDAPLAGACPTWTLLHFPLFVDEASPAASLSQLARAIWDAASAGARLINLSLAILSEGKSQDARLAEALDYAEARGAVITVAAGNQGRIAIGQLLSHPVTIPVVAIDRLGRLLPESNLGPHISRRGVAALGSEVAGYAPGGRIVRMSGTSVATAVVTGILAQVWEERPDLSGHMLRAAMTRLGPRDRAIPPVITLSSVLSALDPPAEGDGSSASPFRGGQPAFVAMQGGSVMTAAASGQYGAKESGPKPLVAPAHVGGGCSCGATPESCTCGSGPTDSNFVYVLGTVDIRFPDQSISDELQRVAATLGIVQGEADDEAVVVDPDEDLRSWYFRVLRQKEARYIARQVCWVLTIENLPAYYLSLSNPLDLDDMIELLGEPRPTPAKASTSKSASGHVKAKPTKQTVSLPPREDYDFSLFVGTSSMVSVEASPGFLAPSLTVKYACAFDRKVLLSWIQTSSGKIPQPRSRKRRAFMITGDGRPDHDFLAHLIQSADNLGDTDEWRALNYLAVQYRPLYRCYADMLEDDYILDSVTVKRSRLSGNKHIVDPIFVFRNSQGGVERYFVRVDVTHLFPTIISQIGPYFER